MDNSLPQPAEAILPEQKEAATLTENSSSSSVDKVVSLSDHIALKHLLDATNDRLDATNNQLKSAIEKIGFYEEQLKLMRQRQFGRQSEKLNESQLELPLFDGVESCDESPSKPEQETITYTRNKPKKPGRKLDTSGLPRCQEHITLTEADRQCQECGDLMEQIGQSVTETVEVIPRQCFVNEVIRPKYACKPCGTLKQAPAVVSSPLPKSFAGCSLIAEVITNKYQLHQPLYRQSQYFKSHGIDIPENTMGNWVMAAGEKLRPLTEPFWSEVLSNQYLQVDETPVKVLKNKKKAYMWCYFSPLVGKKLIIYDYQPTRGKIAVEGRLKNYSGLLQSDGYSGYNALRKSPLITGLGCMAHARRKFAEVVKVAGGTKGIATKIIDQMKGLYALEKKARTEKMTYDQRQKLREEHAPAILDEILTTLRAAQAPPQSGLGKAIQYTLNQWTHLIKYVHHGKAEIDNNWVENKIRPFALGRKNWLFLGHDESAKTGGLLHSLIESAKLNDIPPNQYIHYLLTQVHALRRKEVDPLSLLPHRIDKKMLESFARAHQKRASTALPPPDTS